MTDERKDRTMQNDEIQIGTRVSYEDMANPLREGRIVGEIAGQWAVRWDEHDEVYRLIEQHGLYFHTTVSKSMLERGLERQTKQGGRCAGWNVIPASHDEHDLELAPALLDELGIDERIAADAAALETLLDDDRDDVAIAKALAVIITTPSIRTFLETNDPQALKQARTALGAEPPVQRLGHVDTHTLMRAENTGREVDGVSPIAATAELDRRGAKRLGGPDYRTNDEGADPVDAHTGARLEL